jgi:hypothetical protein
VSYPEQSEFDRLHQLLAQAGDGAGSINEDELIQLLHEAAAAALQRAHRLFPPRAAELDEVADGFVQSFELGRLLGERRAGPQRRGGPPPLADHDQRGRPPGRPAYPAFPVPAASEEAGDQAPPPGHLPAAMHQSGAPMPSGGPPPAPGGLGGPSQDQGGPGGLPRRPVPPRAPAPGGEHGRPAAAAADPTGVWTPSPMPGDRLNTGPEAGLPGPMGGGPPTSADPWTDPRGVAPGPLPPGGQPPMRERAGAPAPMPGPGGPGPGEQGWPPANGTANLSNLMPSSLLNAQQPGEHLPIFEAVRSDWFAKVRDTGGGRNGGAEGMPQVAQARRPAPAERPPPTRAGLPRRVPMTNLAPELPAVPPPPGPPGGGTETPWSARPPGEIGSLLSRYRRGLEQGRSESDQQQQG